MRYYLGEEKVEFFEESGKYFLIRNDERKEVQFRSVAGKNFFSLNGQEWMKIIPFQKCSKVYEASEEYKVYRGFKPSGLTEVDAGSLVSQMPGKIVKVLISTGDEVKKGQTLIILEAMKMENEIKAGKDGVISEIFVSEGESIESSKLMISLEA